MFRLQMCVELRDMKTGRCYRKIHQTETTVEGMDTKPLAEYQSQHPGKSIGFEYTRIS